MTEQQNTKAVDAIVHELNPRVNNPQSWYHEHEREIVRGKLVARVEGILETQAFAEAIENAVRRASSSDSSVGFVRIDRAIAALRWDLGIDREQASTEGTRDQIADELIERLDPHVSHALSEDQLDAIADAVRGMMPPGEEASAVRSPYHCLAEEGHTAHIWAGSWCPGTETPAALQKEADR